MIIGFCFAIGILLHILTMVDMIEEEAFALNEE